MATCLSMVSFIASASSEENLRVMHDLEKVFLSYGSTGNGAGGSAGARQRSNYYDEDEEEFTFTDSDNYSESDDPDATCHRDDGVYGTAIRGWSLMSTLLETDDVPALVRRNVGDLEALLDSDSLNITMAAGEALILLYVRCDHDDIEVRG